MDSRVLRTFVTVARCASFSAAADELSLTQAAVSQQIAALETELGASLLHRRPVVPPRPGAGCSTTRGRSCSGSTRPAWRSRG